MAKKITQNLEKKKVPDQKSKIAVKAPGRLPVWIVLAIFFVTTFIFFWDQIFQNSFFWEDFVEYIFPVQTFAAKEFSKFSIPFWNPFTFLGMPFMADLQVGFFYPLNRMLSLVFISGNQLPVIAIELVIILHFFIAQISMYLLARYWKISSYGSIIASVSYAFSMMMVCHVIHPMIVYHLAWFPMILMLFLKGINTQKYYYSIYSGLLFGMTMLSGHPQTTLYEALFLLFAFVWFLIAGIRKKEIEGMKILYTAFASLIPIIVAAGIFAIQYLPSKELANLSQRNEITYEKATEGSLQFKNIYTAFVPKIFGSVDGKNEKNPSYYLETNGSIQRHFYWETTFYFGIVALFLGLFAIGTSFRRREAAFLIFIGLFGFLYALGESSFIFDIFYGLPLFGTFRNPSRMMFFVITAFSILAAMGFDKLWENRKKYDYIILLIAGLIPLIVLLLASSGSFFDSFSTPEIVRSSITESATTSLILMVIAIAVAFLCERTILKPAAAGLILAAIAMFDLFLVGASFNQNPQNPVKSYEMKPDIKTLLTPNPPKEIFRVNMRLFEPIRFMAMQRNQGLIDKLMLIEGYNPLILEKVRPPLDDNQKIHDLYNVRYEVKVDLEKGSWAFAERTTQFPRAWLVNNYQIVPEDQVKNKMKYGTYDYHQIVLLEEEPGIKTDPSGVDSVSDEVTCLEYNNNNFKYKVKASQAGVLCFSEIWYPAWKAYVNGKPAKMLRANYCFRAVSVNQGEQTVEMRYESSSFVYGAYISGITFLLALLGLLFSHRFQQ